MHPASEGSRHGWVPIPHQVTHVTLKTLGLMGAFKIPWSKHSLTDEKIPKGQRKKAPGVHTLAQGCRDSAIFFNLQGGWSLGLANQRSSPVMYSSSSSAPLCPAQGWDSVCLCQAELSLSSAGTLHGPDLLPQDPRGGHWCWVVDGLRPSSRETSGRTGLSSHF